MVLPIEITTIHREISQAVRPPVPGLTEVRNAMRLQDGGEAKRGKMVV